MTQDISWSNLPNRFLLIKFYESLSTTNVPFSIPSLHSKTNVTELRRIFIRVVSKLLPFNFKNVNNLEAEFENQFHLSKKLASINLDKSHNPKQYFDCKSQLDIIRILRKSFDED